MIYKLVKKFGFDRRSRGNPKWNHALFVTFEPLGLQVTTIAQNDRNYLKISNFQSKKFFFPNM